MVERLSVSSILTEKRKNHKNVVTIRSVDFLLCYFSFDSKLQKTAIIQKNEGVSLIENLDCKKALKNDCTNIIVLY